MSNHHLVPGGPRRLDGGDLRHGEINSHCFLDDIGGDRERPVGIERRFCAGFETYRRSNIGTIARLHCRIPEQQGLSVGIGAIDFYAPRPFGDVCQLGGEEPIERAGNVGALGISDRVEFGAAFLVRQRLELFDRGWLLEVVAEHCDVDVFGKAPDEVIVFRQRCAALEQQPRLSCRPFMIERIEGPANSEVLFDIADWGADAVGRGEEQIEQVTWRCGNSLTVGVGAHG